MAPPRRSAASVIDAARLIAYSSVDSGASPAWTEACRSRTIQASPPSRLEATAHQPAQPGRRGPVDPLHAVGWDVLSNRGGIWRDVEHAAAQLLIPGGARRQRIQAAHRSDHGVDDHRLAAGDPQRTGKESKRIAVAQLNRAEGKQASLLEPAPRCPPARAAPLQAEHAPRVVTGEV